MSSSLRNSALVAVLALMTVCGCNGFGAGQATTPGNTPNIAAQTSYRIVGDVGTPFRALVSNTRSSWQIFGTIPTSIVIVNDSPPDRIVVTKLSNDSRLLSLELIGGFSIGTLDSTVASFGTAVASAGGKLTAFAPAASPDVRFIVKSPAVGLFTALIEDQQTGHALMSRIPAVILFDSPGTARVDGIFHQVSFAGVFDIDLTINGRLVASIVGGGLSSSLKGG
jgi:hypothetical protein